jgi:hypothetical protein
MICHIKGSGLQLISVFFKQLSILINKYFNCFLFIMFLAGHEKHLIEVFILIYFYNI